MSDYNHVGLSGRLTRNAELKYTPSGMAVCEFGIASNRKFKEKEEVAFVDCCMFGDRAVSISQYLTKGKKLIVAGRLRFESWENDGQKRSKLTVVVEDVTFVEPPQQNTVAEPVEVERVAKEVDFNVDETVPF